MMKTRCEIRAIYIYSYRREKATLVNLHENLATGWACRVTCVELLNKIGVVEKNTGLILVIYLGLVRIGLVG